ncbi:hypothetical protein ACLMJK_004639 [Lecanora helva]
MVTEPSLTPQTPESTPKWDEPEWMFGQLFMMGFDGTEVTTQIRELIEKNHIGTILLTAKNLISADQTTKLVLDLQTIAHNAGHPVPLAIALDQENGGVNSLFDSDFIRQFPSAMALAATGSVDMAYEVAKATAEELRCVGINWIMGPCLDVLTNVKNQPLGVRSTGDDPEEVSKYGTAFLRGFKDAGIASCGKHFPSYGNLEFLGSSLDVPVITESLEQLSLSALIPFRSAITQGVDSMMVGGCAMSSAGVNAMHACLSEQVVDDLLRQNLGFDGVVVSECLEMEALSHNIGVGGGTVMAVNAGCDLILVCKSWSGQHEAFEGLKTGLDNGVVTHTRLRRSLQRMLDMKEKYLTWEKALSPQGVERLSAMRELHDELATKAYSESITVVRDKDHLLPLSNILEPDEELLLLSPLVNSLPASAAAQRFASHIGIPRGSSRESLMQGESIFQELGRSLARERNGRVLHTSYTSNGLRPVHENLIYRASAVIVITADANRNLYQHGFAKHVSAICKLTKSTRNREKPLIVVSVSSPYDFAMDPSLSTYVCTYDYTESALRAVVHVLMGKLPYKGVLPGSLRQNQKVHQSRQHWLVEAFDRDRDLNGLKSLIERLQQDTSIMSPSLLNGCSPKTFLLHNAVVEEAHFVVRNSSTQALYGFCSTYHFLSTCTGVIATIFVDPERRNMSIGRSLHTRAMKHLLQKQGVKRCQLGSRLPSVFLGIPSNRKAECKLLREWFGTLGWDVSRSKPLCSMLLPQLESWVPRPSLEDSLKQADLEFDLVCGRERADDILDLVKTNSPQQISEIYDLALADASGSAVIRANRKSDAALLGAVVVYNKKSAWAKEAVPALRSTEGLVGGISGPVISACADESAHVLQGLILIGIQQHQRQQSTAVLLDCIDGVANIDSLSAMGFTILQEFDEISCNTDTFTVPG